MAHKISKADAIKKYERELKNKELIKQGKQVKSNRWERKRKAREESKKKWYDMLTRRGGLAKEDKSKENKEDVQE